jgi:Cu/Ag efflux protein CusF
MKYVRFGLLIGIGLSLFLSSGYAGQDKKTAGKKEYTFRGKVEKIDVNAKTFVVNGQKVEGWMGAMTMSYAPDKADVLNNLKVGDEITAKVYDGDFHTLHDVHVVPPNGDAKAASEKKK